MSNKFRREVDTYLTAKGWEKARTKGKHIVWKHAVLGTLTTSGTPGNTNALTAVKRDVARLERVAG